MKEEIIEALKEHLIEGYEFPPNCGREGRLQLVVLDEDEIDEVSDKIAGLLNQKSKIKMPAEIYAVIFNPMIHESGFVTLSVHRTKRGAEMAMEFHKAATIDEDGGLDNCKFWDVVKMTVED